MKTIAEQWLEFSTMVLPDNVADVQRREMRRAFYAGFTASLFTFVEVTAEQTSEEEAIATLNRFVTESAQFKERIDAGLA